VGFGAFENYLRSGAPTQTLEGALEGNMERKGPRERRAQNQLLGMGPVVQPEPIIVTEGVLYNSVTGESGWYYTFKERDEMLDSGEWVSDLRKVGPHNAKNYDELVHEQMAISGMEVEVDEKIVEKHRELVNYAEKIQLTKPQSPKKKYLTMMNRNELFAEGKRWGLRFDEEDPPTKLDMVHSIKLAQKDQKGIPLR